MNGDNRTTDRVDPRLISNFDLPSMPNMRDLRFAVAATKSKVSSSSLSNVRMAGESGPASSCSC